jgi:two-component system, OmpR family, response regulator VicR
MKKILIVEDDEFLSDAYNLVLTNENFLTDVARDGVEALLKADAFFPDLILLDLVMPKKDGFQTLKELKGNPKTNPIPVIVATNLELNESVKAELMKEAVDYYIKSNIAMTDLIQKCKHYLSQ